MSRVANPLLARFPEISTRTLSAAREATARFWPKHTSTVLGPDEYALEMNRVVLGHAAMTFVACTSRIRVVSTAPATEYAVYLPFEGDIQIVAAGVQMAATARRPLLRGPARTFVFEPSPIRCLVIDIPVAVLAAAAGRQAALPGHVSIAESDAPMLVRLATGLAHAADRSRTLVALQRFSIRDRLARLPDRIRRLEDTFVETVVGLAKTRPGVRGECDVELLKQWLAGQAHRRVRIGELASLAGVSQRTVERAFLRTGCTPLDYLRRIRLDRARTILAGPVANVTVADVAASLATRTSDDSPTTIAGTSASCRREPSPAAGPPVDHRCRPLTTVATGLRSPTPAFARNHAALPTSLRAGHRAAMLDPDQRKPQANTP